MNWRIIIFAAIFLGGLALIAYSPLVGVLATLIGGGGVSVEGKRHYDTADQLDEAIDEATQKEEQADGDDLHDDWDGLSQ